MSAWYVFAALGLYPTDPARPAYELAVPLFPKAVAHLDIPYMVRQFMVDAPTTSDANMYLRGLRVGDQAWPKPWVTLEEILCGGTLTYSLESVPDRVWGAGRETRLPSL